MKIYIKYLRNYICPLSEIQGLSAAGLVNATVLTPGQPVNVGGQPFHITTTGSASSNIGQRPGPQRMIIANQPTGVGVTSGALHHVATGTIGQPKLLVPAQQVTLLSNGGSVANATQNIEIKKEGLIINSTICIYLVLYYCTQLTNIPASTNVHKRFLFQIKLKLTKFCQGPSE